MKPLFDPVEFTTAVPSDFLLAGALFTRLQSEGTDVAEKELLHSIIGELRSGTLDSYTPPPHRCTYLVKVLQFFIDHTMASVDTENDYAIDAALDVLARHRALQQRYSDLERSPVRLFPAPSLYGTFHIPCDFRLPSADEQHK